LFETDSPVVSEFYLVLEIDSPPTKSGWVYDSKRDLFDATLLNVAEFISALKHFICLTLRGSKVSAVKQARNQFGTPGGARSYLSGAQNL